MGRWRYEPDEIPKRRHHWNRDVAGFIETPEGLRVGKCPSNLRLEDAEAMLDSGIPWSPPRWNRDYPQRIYAIRDGVLYRAIPTVPGRSYHGFPELASRVPSDRRLHCAIMELARKLGCEAEMAKWLKK